MHHDLAAMVNDMPKINRGSRPDRLEVSPLSAHISNDTRWVQQGSEILLGVDAVCWLLFLSGKGLGCFLGVVGLLSQV